MTGGARESLWLKGASSGNGVGARKTSPHMSSLRRNDRAMNSGGGAPVACVHPMDLAATDCLRQRLEKLDSSISGRIAWRSSVAETTGNSKTSAHPSTRHVRYRAKRCGQSAHAGLFRRIQSAGSARAAHRMLSKSSISREGENARVPILLLKKCSENLSRKSNGGWAGLFPPRYVGLSRF